MSFSIKDILHNKASALMHLETDPGLGCTEPAAIGFCAASAASLLGTKDFDSLEVRTDANIFKNAMGVIIPCSGGNAGAPFAAAMGAIAGNHALKLQVFADVNERDLEKTKALLAGDKVSVGIEEGADGIYVKTTIKAGGRSAEAVVQGRHDNLISLSLDGAPVKDHPGDSAGTDDGASFEDVEKWLTGLTLRDMTDLLDMSDKDDLEYIRNGLDLNMKLAKYGLSRGAGIGIGKTKMSLLRQGLLKKDMAVWASILASAGIDSRMGGVDMPAMTLAGSGNQGIAASLPIVGVSEFITLEDQTDVLRAVMLSYLVTCFIKTNVGRLSALCGSGVASGAGVAAGVTYLCGGDTVKIGGAIKNHIESFATVVCDGAKTSCALKVGQSTWAAVESALFALQGTVVRSTDGIISESAEDTMRNLAKLSSAGLACMDSAILEVMLSKCK